MSKFLKHYFHKFSDNHGNSLDKREFLPLPQNNVLSRIKNLGQHCKGEWGNLVHSLSTCPIIFFTIVDLFSSTLSSSFNYGEYEIHYSG